MSIFPDLKKFLPDRELKNLDEIDLNIFDGAKLVVWDIDNTLFYPSTTKVNKKALESFRKIAQKVDCLAVSNSRKIIKERALEIEKILGCKVYNNKGLRKPSSKLFKNVQKDCFLKPTDKVVVIGDTWATDTLFAKRNGQISILVEPFSKKEAFFIKVGRFFVNKPFLSIIKKL